MRTVVLKFVILNTKGSVNLERGRKTKERIDLGFQIEQRKNHKTTNESFEPLMKNIADFFKGKLYTSKHPQVEYWNLEVFTLNGLEILMKYLSIYPLLTTKGNDFDDFHKAFQIMIAKQHLTVEGKESIYCLKNQINRKRNQFNWDHLNKESCPV